MSTRRNVFQLFVPVLSILMLKLSSVLVFLIYGSAHKSCLEYIDQAQHRILRAILYKKSLTT